jgi:hypothetical protein
MTMTMGLWDSPFEFTDCHVTEQPQRGESNLAVA